MKLRLLGDATRYALSSLNAIYLGVPKLFLLIAGGAMASICRHNEVECRRLLSRQWLVTAIALCALTQYIVINAARYDGIYVPAMLLGGLLMSLLGSIAIGVATGTYYRFVGPPPYPEDEPAHHAQTQSRAAPFGVPENLQELLAERIRGQDMALEELCAAVQTSARNYANGKSLGMYLLVGATGSGKTETAKQLAAILGWPLHREECNQYTTQHGVSRLIGSAMGYVDSDVGGSLTNALRSSRHGVLLLDEIEKAHASVSRTLMTLADEGFISTARGDVVDARGWIILATSNASQAEIVRIAENVNFKSYERTAAMKRALAEHWPAEIIARMRSVVPYKPVSPEAMMQVFRDMIMRQISDSGATPDHRVHIAPSALSLLSEAYRTLRQYGVREMHSFIERDLALPLMRFMDGDLLDFSVEAEGDRLVILPWPNSRTKTGLRKPSASVSRIAGWFGLAEKR